MSPDTDRDLIINTVRQFVRKEVVPVASAMEHRNEYPHALVDQMRAMGLFGLNIPEAFGGAAVDTTTFAMIFEEISRGWLGLAGVLGTHSVMCDVLARFGTSAQQARFLPSMASGERRGGICLTESNAGTDLQNISTTATRDGEYYLVNGSKMWITNARHGNTFLLLAKTDPAAQPAHRGMSAFIIEKGAPGMKVGRDIDKLGYKGVETCELHFENFAVPAENLIGGAEGQGFKQVMTGLEAERLNVAARGLGIARAAFDEAIRYAQRRVTFGKPIAEY
jgi:alkylation response protein AidB-like acyl-CoA dehydrogenase